MAFPTTGILDTFDRANEGPPPSASWSSLGFNNPSSGLSVVSNELADNGGGQGGAWGTQFGPDCEIYVTVSVLPSLTGQFFELFLRGAQIGDGSTVDGYSFKFTRDDAIPGVNFQLRKVTNGVSTNIGASVNNVGLLANGVKFGASAVSDQLTAYVNRSGTWSSIVTQTDSTYAGSGFIGYQARASQRGDDFGGGTYVPPFPYTIINGTLSQLANVNTTGDDVDAMSYKASVSLAQDELATLASTQGVFVTADTSVAQMRLIIKRVIRNAST